MYEFMDELEEVNKKIKNLNSLEHIHKWTIENPDLAKKAKDKWYSEKGKEYQKIWRRKNKKLNK